MASPSGQHLPLAINQLHMAAAERSDADGVSVISKCLAALTQLQAKDHAAHSEGNQAVQTVMSQLGGSSGGGY